MAKSSVERTLLPYKPQPGAEFSPRHISLMIKGAAGEYSVDDLQNDANIRTQIVEQYAPPFLPEKSVTEACESDAFKSVGLENGKYQRMLGHKSVRIVPDKFSADGEPLIYVIYMKPKSGIKM